jgi:hypothetical protein
MQKLNAENTEKKRGDGERVLRAGFAYCSGIAIAYQVYNGQRSFLATWPEFLFTTGKAVAILLASSALI